MRWLFRFMVYFVKPVLCWYIAGYFGWQSVKAIAYAVVSYEKAVEKAKIQAAAKAEKIERKGRPVKE